jgi:tRNA (mo5U34)-methyltransferase
MSLHAMRLDEPEPQAKAAYTYEELRQRVAELGDWFHRMNLNGVDTNPHHFLGDYPNVKFRRFQRALPEDLTGKSVLDIGCNAGFYSIEMKKRGAARVVGIDSDDRYLAQARLAAEVLGHEIEFAKLDVYDVGALGEKFDLVIFMGVLYHLRHPLLALDLIHEHVAGDMLLFQTMQRGSESVSKLAKNYPFSVRSIFDRDDYPKMHFIEHQYSNDPTNWWVPNRACTEAMLRSAGFDIESRPEREVYICRRRETGGESGAAYPKRGGTDW